MRGVTRSSGFESCAVSISTHTPHAGSDPPSVRLSLVFCTISTHTPHAGSDQKDVFKSIDFDKFLPTLPMRGVTVFGYRIAISIKISTHTPHAGSDQEVN